MPAPVLNIRDGLTNEVVLSILGDGSVELGFGMTEDRAAKAFWGWVATRNPLFETANVAIHALEEIAQWEAHHGQKLYSQVAYRMSRVAVDALRKVRED